MVGGETSRSRKGDFELRHWRSSSSSSSSSSSLSEKKKKQPSLRRRATAVPPAIEIPNGGGGGGRSELENGSFGSERGYTSLRDILSSPRYSSASAADSPIVVGGGGGSCAEIRITNPLVKQAAYAYLQPTPSMQEPSSRRRSRLCRFLLALACCCSGGAGRGGSGRGGAAALFGPCFDFLGRLFGR